jgi:hypothetical protein
MICMCRNRQTRRSPTGLGRYRARGGGVRPLRRAHLGLGFIRPALPHSLAA